MIEEISEYVLNKIVEMDCRTKSGKDSEKKIIVRATTDRKSFRVMNIHVLKGHGMSKKTNKLMFCRKSYTHQHVAMKKYGFQRNNLTFE